MAARRYRIAALLCAITALASLPTRGLRSGTATPAEMDRWRAAIREALFVPVPLPTLDTRSYGKFYPASGVRAERVTYGTEFGMRVPAIVYSPENPPAKRLPALVVVNGHGGDKYSWYSFYTGILYARAGGVVVTYDPLGEGERNRERRSGTRAHDREIDGPHTGERMGGQMIADVMQAVSYLRTRKDVDGSRIGVLGYSMGSFVAALTGAIDDRIHAVVLSGGGDLDGNGGYWDTSSKTMCQARPYRALSFLEDKAAVIYALNQRRGPILIMNGTDDTVVDIPHHLEPFFADLRQRAERIAGSKTNALETYFVLGVSHRPSWVTRPAALWLQRVLRFPGWNEAIIRSLPETHISEWAAKNHVEMDRGYIQEDREGGVMALRDDVPNIPRHQLDVLTDQQWKEQKNQFVYELWVQHVLAADGIMGVAAVKFSETASVSIHQKGK